MTTRNSNLLSVIKYHWLVAFSAICLISCEDASELSPPPETITKSTSTSKAIHARVATETFPLGWYSSIDYPEALAEIKADGMNTVIPYVDLERQSLETIEAYLDEANAQGLAVCLQIPRKSIIWQFNYASTLEQARADLRAYVQRFKNHPALLNWYLYDEPNVSTDPDIRRATTPLALQRAYDVIKDEDPQHTISIVYNRLPSDDPNQTEFDLAYLEPTDVIMFDYYPVEEGYAAFESPEWKNFGPLVARGTAVAADVPGKEYWKVLQGYGGRYNKKLPTAAEERYMLYTSIVSKATGIFFWTHYLSDPTWIDEVLRPLIQDFAPLRSAIAAGPVSPGGESTVRHSSPDDLNLRYQLFRDNAASKFFLVVVNESDRAGIANVGVKPGRKITNVEDRSTGQIVPLINANPSGALDYVFQDTFQPYEAIVYELADVTQAEQLAIRAKGACGTERMELHVDGTPVQAWTNVKTTFATYTYDGFNGGEVSVHFVNDQAEGCDRNLTIDYVEACGQRIESESDQVAQSADWTNGDQQVLFTNGSNRYGNLDCRKPEQEGTLVIRAKSSQGTERMDLHVDGQPVKSWTVATAPDNYVYEGYGGGSIRVVFEDDGGEGPTDRNLAINYLIVCGTKYEDNAEGVSRTNCGEDNRQGFTWLYCNGSLDFGNPGCSNAKATASTR